MGGISRLELESFYGSSQSYLMRLKSHDETIFSPYIKLIQNYAQNGALLDCGCGIGLSSYLLAKSGFLVKGIDISPLFISEAKKNYGSQNNLEFLVQDMRNLTFPDNSFDVIGFYDCLEHVLDVRDVLKEVSRVIKKGGIAIIFMPNLLNPVKFFYSFFSGKSYRSCKKPWEAKNRLGNMFCLIRSMFLSVLKSLGVNRKIYYLKPVLSNQEDYCGRDYDATWLANWFDIENLLKELNFSVQCVLPENLESRILSIMGNLKFPKAIQNFYIKLISGCIIVGRKKNAG